MRLLELFVLFYYYPNDCVVVALKFERATLPNNNWLENIVFERKLLILYSLRKLDLLFKKFPCALATMASYMKNTFLTQKESERNQDCEFIEETLSSLVNLQGWYCISFSSKTKVEFSCMYLFFIRNRLLETEGIDFQNLRGFGRRFCVNQKKLRNFTYLS